MDLVDALFPQQAAASNLRNISTSLAGMSTAGRMTNDQLRKLAGDLGLVTLLLMSLVRSLVEKGVVTQEEITGRLQELDHADGVADGKLSPDALRAIMGVPRKETPAPASRLASESLKAAKFVRRR